MQGLQPGDALVALESPEGKFVDKLVQLYQPSRIRKPRRVRMGASPDGWLVQQFAHNAWSAVCALTSSSETRFVQLPWRSASCGLSGCTPPKVGGKLQGAVVANRMKQGLIWCVQQLTVVTRM